MPGKRPLLFACALGVASTVGARAFADGPPATTLEASYRKALVLNEDVEISHQNELVAKETETGAWTILGPRASLNFNGIVEREENPIIDPDPLPTLVYPRSLYTTGATITQPLFRRGFWAARDAGRAGVDAAHHLEFRAEQQLMFSVATAYLAVMSSRELLKLAHDAVTRAETQLSVSEARQKAGGALKTASQLAEVEVDRAKLLVARAEGDVRTQEVAYERLVGELPPAAMEMPTATQVPSVGECYKTVADRSDSRALRELAAQSIELENAAKGELYPTLDAQATANYSSFTYPFGSILLWNARVVLTVPLFQSGAEYTKISQQRIQTRIAELQLSKQDRQTRAEIGSASSLLETSQHAEQIAAAQVAVATEHYELISAQFKVGAITILDVANAQVVLIDAERERTTAQFGTTQASYQLMFACGTIRL